MKDGPFWSKCWRHIVEISTRRTSFDDGALPYCRYLYNKGRYEHSVILQSLVYCFIYLFSFSRIQNGINPGNLKLRQWEQPEKGGKRGPFQGIGSTYFILYHFESSRPEMSSLIDKLSYTLSSFLYSMLSFPSTNPITSSLPPSLWTLFSDADGTLANSTPAMTVGGTTPGTVEFPSVQPVHDFSTGCWRWDECVRQNMLWYIGY